MERAGCKTTSGLQKLEGDDVEKSIEVLDKVLSEFEDPDSLPHIPVHIEPESPSQGNQSEDDGYMSMNGRRAKIPPDFHQPLSNESPASPPHLMERNNSEELTDDINKITNNNNNKDQQQQQQQQQSSSTSPTSSSSILASISTTSAAAVAATTTITTTVITKESSPTSPLNIQKQSNSNNTTTLELSIQEPIKVTIKSSPVSATHQTNGNNNITEKTEEIIKSNQPPPPEVAEAIISNLLPRSPSITQKQIIESPLIDSELIVANTDRINNAKNLQNCVIQLDRKHITSASCNKNGMMVVQNVSIGNITTPTSNCNLTENDCVIGQTPHKWNKKDENIPNESSTITEQQNNSNSSGVSGVGVCGNQTSPAQQTTLPKTRPSNVNPSKYSSLPCSGPTRLGRNLSNTIGSGSSFDSGTGDRNILGIGISAVHDAVLRGGVAKLPEPILNEHPVTIYPGRASPIGKQRVPPRTLPGSIERHREVCRNNLNNELHSPTQQTIYDPTEGNPPSYVLLTSSSTTNMSPLQRLAITKSPSSPLVAVQQHIILQNSVSSNQLIDNKNLLNSLQIPPCKPKRNNIHNNKTILTTSTNGRQENDDNINDIDTIDNNNCNRKKINGATTTDSSSEEEFSDDSLEEGQSLPPPPAPPLVPPPPSLSAPVTPSKRGSIAWEINLDDHLPPPPPPHQISDKQIKLEKRLGKSNHNNQSNNNNNNINNNNNNNNNNHNNNNKNIKSSDGNKKSNSNSGAINGSSKEKKIEKSASAKIIARRRARSQSGDNLIIINNATDNDSISSFASTPGNSGGSMSQNASPQHRNHHIINHTHLTSKNRSSSLEWPDPPDAPICSTEDEAASIYSDSDDIIPTYPVNLTGKGTYVIRKGRKERSRLSDVHTSMSSSINSRLSNEGSLLSGMTASQSLLIPNSRHSIDLGSSTHSPISIGTGCNNILPNNRGAILSPRSRLSLDLTSPNTTNTDHPVSLNQILQSPVTNGGGSVGGGVGGGGGGGGSNAGTPNSRFNDFKSYTNSYDQMQHHIETNGNGESTNVLPINGNTVTSVSTNSLNNNNNNNSSSNNNNNNIITNATANLNGSLTHDISSTPRRELAPPIEEDEEQDSESQASRGAPLRQIENNISALLRGDIAVARIGDIGHPRRPIGFRPGVHKSESAKEMLLSQINNFGPLPPSPPTSSPEPEIDSFPPLPPSPQENNADDEEEIDETNMMRGVHGLRISSRTRLKTSIESHAPAIPPHRSGNLGVQPPSINTLKTRSMDASYAKKYNTNSSHISVPGTLPCEIPTTNSSRRRLQSGAFPKRSAQSPREERRLQTSCSLPETPIFARGCDIPRTPHRRAPEVPPHGTVVGTNNCGSRTAPRSNTNTTSSLSSSIVGIGNSTLGNTNGRHQPQPPQPQRSITQALTGAEMLRLAGGPARGWYPKQRAMRPASTEHLDRLHRTQGSMRAWDTAIGVGGHHTSGGVGGMSGRGGVVGGNECVGRKPLTLPPNLTPKFFNKSPREALRRVTSLLIKKGNGKDKESKHHRDKDVFTTSSIHRSPGSAGDIPIPNHMYINNGSTSSSSTTTTTSNNHPIQQNQSQINEHSKNSGHNQTTHKKKGFFKSFWKKSKHYSLDQQ